MKDKPAPSNYGTANNRRQRRSYRMISVLYSQVDNVAYNAPPGIRLGAAVQDITRAGSAG